MSENANPRNIPDLREQGPDANLREELTDAERDALMHHIGGWKFERQGLANAEDAFMAEVSRIVIARVIAAEQAGREDNALHDMCYVSGSKALEAREAAARREALLEAERALLAQAASIEDNPVTAFGRPDIYRMGRKDGYQFGAGVVAHLDDLAEPERDEEAGND